MCSKLVLAGIDEKESKYLVRESHMYGSLAKILWHGDLETADTAKYERGLMQWLILVKGNQVCQQRGMKKRRG